MISIGKVNSQGSGYYAADNYYTAGEATAQSAWFGRAADDLGLSGTVSPDTFDRLLSGRLPDGTQLDARRGELRAGLDLTFSPSKSVSLLALVGGDKRIVAELKSAVAVIRRRPPASGSNGERARRPKSSTARRRALPPRSRRRRRRVRP